MKVTYNNFSLSDLGEINISQRRDFEGGEAPQRARVTVAIKIAVFARCYADNYALLRQAKVALATPNALLFWQNEDTGETYISQTATLTEENFPEEWGTYFQELDLSFSYYENLDTSAQNLPLTFLKEGAGKPILFDHVTGWTEGSSTERFSNLRKHRREVRGRLEVKGSILGDPTLPLAERRTALAAQVPQLRDAMTSAQGRLVFGLAGQQMFNRDVRIVEFNAAINQAITEIEFTFSATYTAFPDEGNYATTEATIAETDNMSGELTLTVSGKIQATDEVTARAKLASLTTAILKQYGYDKGQQLEISTTPNLISANSDGDTFTELDFGGRWRKWRATNQLATFAKTGSTRDPVPFGNVRTWIDSYQASRFDELRDQRRLATSTIEVGGTLAGDPTVSLADRRAALLAAQRRLKAEVNGGNGTLVYGDFSEVVRVDDFRAEINQAETGIDWSLKAHYTLFPNEDSYATVEATFAEADNFTGETVLTANGKISAVDEATARAKLATVLAAALKQYAYDAGQQLELDTTPNLISANEDGQTTTELTFTGRWRKFRSTNQLATYTPPGAPEPVPFGNVRQWASHYTASRFNILRGQRERGTVDIEASGTFAGDPTVTLADRRAQLIAAQQRMLAAVNSVTGVVKYGQFSQTMKVDDFRADIYQAETGIDWSFKAHYTLFPNEANYATTEATFGEADPQTGEFTLSLSGRIQSNSEAAARTKLAAVLKAALKQYGYDNGQELELTTTPNLISANEDGDTFTELSFSGRWRRWSKDNQIATYQGGGTEPLSLGNVRTWTDHYTATRFNVMRDQRERAQVELDLAGTWVCDPTMAIKDRRAALLKIQRDLKAEINGPSGILKFGDFSQRVRVDDFRADINQAITGIDWQMRCHYTLFPDESSYATCEATAEERVNFTGEAHLNVNGRIQAATEAIARTKLAAVLAVFLKQYGYDGTQGGSQQLELNTTPNQISANGDGDTFTELSFNGAWRRFSVNNQQCTFKRTGSTSQPIPFGNVRSWDDGYRAERFDQMRSERRHATGMLNASGTLTCDPTMKLADRRAALLAAQRKMKAECNAAEGTLKYGDFTQVVRIEEFTAHVNQAETGIDWTFTANYSLFPNEGGYATAEFTADMRDDVESGDRVLTFAGEIDAPNGSLARAKLATLRTATLGIYGFTIGQQLRASANTRDVSANGDATSTVAEGMETAGDVSGVTFLRLTFNEEYRQRMPGQIVNCNYTISSRDDTTTGMLMTTYAGTIVATGSTADSSAAAALVKAMQLGANKESSIDPSAFLKSQSLSLERRQTSSSVPEEFVRLTFSYEYQSRLGAGRAYLEMNSAVQTDTFGPDSESVSGFVVAKDFLTAQAIYVQQAKSSYAGRLIRNENVTQSTVQAETKSNLVVPTDTFAFTIQAIRLEFSFTAHRDKPPGRITAKYAISVQRDFRARRRVSRLHGSVFATTRAAADTFLLVLTAPLGQLMDSNRDEDHDYTPELDVFTKLDFEDRYEGVLTEQQGLIEMHVSETVTYSATRWAVQPIPFTTFGGGGVSIPQAAGLTEGSRVIRGTVTAATQAVALAWAYRHRAMMTGDRDGGLYPQPEQIETDYEFAPRVDGVAEDGLAGSGSKGNVQVYRINFQFAELLPNYPPSA